MKKEITVLIMLMVFILLFKSGNSGNELMSYMGIGIMVIIALAVTTKQI